MPKVALINPGSCEKETLYSATEPLNLGFIAGYLEKNNIEVKIFDELSGQDVIKEIDSFKPETVGITATTPLITRAYQIADYCRKKGILTVMGGVHVSVLPEEALAHCDIVVKGEGEIAMLDIIKGNIKSGIISRQYIKNLDEIPPPARHHMNMKFYLHSRDRLPYGHFSFAPPRSKCASVMSSRGCPYSCIFCHNSWRGTPVRFNTPERIISEIKSLVSEYNVNALFFCDDELFANKNRLEKICNSIIEEKLNIVWCAAARVNSLELELLQLAYRAGCRKLNIGLESGSQRILDILNKKTTVEQNKIAVGLCKKAGIKIGGTFMIGNPTETLEDINLTVKFIKENKLYENDDAGVLITTPFPGTKLWQWCEEKNLIPKNFSWSDFTFTKAPIIANDIFSSEEIEKICRKINQELYEKRPIKLFQFMKNKLSHPLTLACKSLKEPKKIFSYLKRLRI